MKSIITAIVFLLAAEVVTAQHFYYGFNLGGTGYTYNLNSTTFNSGAFSIGVNPQFVLKDSSFGFEFDASLYSHSTYTGNSVTTAGYTLTPYFFFNTAKKARIAAFMLRVGIFYGNLNNSFQEPSYDFGPSFGIYLFFKVAPEFYLGPDLSFIIGQKFYTLQEPGPRGSTTPNPVYSSQLSIATFSFKILFR